MKKLWVVAALCVAAANSVQATEVEVVWDGEVRKVEVDGAYTSVHPQQKGLQAVIAGDLRPAVRTLEMKVADHEGRISVLEQAPPASQEKKENPGTSGPSQKGGVRMDPVVILGFFLLGAGILTCFIILLTQRGRGGRGQQALGTAQNLLTHVGNQGRLAISVQTQEGDNVSLRYEPMAAAPAQPAVVPPAPVSQAPAPVASSGASSAAGSTAGTIIPPPPAAGTP